MLDTYTKEQILRMGMIVVRQRITSKIVESNFTLAYQRLQSGHFFITHFEIVLMRVSLKHIYILLY